MMHTVTFCTVTFLYSDILYSDIFVQWHFCTVTFLYIDCTFGMHTKVDSTSPSEEWALEMLTLNLHILTWAQDGVVCFHCQSALTPAADKGPEVLGNRNVVVGWTDERSILVDIQPSVVSNATANSVSRRDTVQGLHEKLALLAVTPDVPISSIIQVSVVRWYSHFARIISGDSDLRSAINLKNTTNSTQTAVHNQQYTNSSTQPTIHK